MTQEGGNSYLDQVVAQQAMLEGDLRSRRAAPPVPPKVAAPGGAPFRAVAAPGTAGGPGPVDVRISGWWRWKTVVVPPNAFVVHTRRGRPAPLHLGLGVSFRYNPATDSFLVVPGATQTILINAYCICQELQGVLVQGYVQWIIQDFGTAYRKLDFSDNEDPMRLVNLQLKEQAEAAIKDKVSTMAVRDVLSDKQTIIEELTARLRAVAEGEDTSDQGLGLRIVTVQIKEAVVSSTTLWKNLQKPYRSEQARIARIAELAAEEAISEREMQAARQKETQRIEHEREVAELRARNEARRFDTEAAENLRRTHREHDDARDMAALEQETALHKLTLRRERQAEEAAADLMCAEQERELARLRAEAELELAATRGRAAHDLDLLQVERERLRAAVANEQTPESIQARLVDSLPDIVQRLPKPDELRSVTLAGDPTSLTGVITELTAVLDALRTPR
ncbi:SPFH domain/Band 7 family protein [Actinocorallia herbida]|uniref:SPFH domain/Band 7 family protein n=1 Tax=Actinocorallia herbida TaxID=58109 RepID=A0A3N1D2J3_9ACTN|nr:SPFH domain-containing protein [Actinocorallia herbida]ROO87706.1 SPFH domain/Band 7 family protein [Actinocorallia herbida]